MTAKRGDAPFDLDAARAARQEAAGEGFKFTWGGKPYECPAAEDWPLAVQSSLSEGDLLGALRNLLGDKQMNEFEAGKPTMGDVKDLFDAIAKFSGVGDSGNS